MNNTRLHFGPLGLGVAPLDNLYARVSDEETEATLTTAVRQGIEWFDAAPLYGFGLAEARVGRFLRRMLDEEALNRRTAGKHSSPAGRPALSTKVGRVLEPTAAAQDHEHFVAPLAYRPVFDYSAHGIERSYEEG